MKIGKPKHFTVRHSETACGLTGKGVNQSYSASDTDCLSCRKTKAFKAKPYITIMDFVTSSDTVGNQKQDSFYKIIGTYKIDLWDKVGKLWRIKDIVTGVESFAREGYLTKWKPVKKV